MPLDPMIFESIGFGVVAIVSVVWLLVTLKRATTLNIKRSLARFLLMAVAICGAFVVATVYSPTLIDYAVGYASGTVPKDDGSVIAMLINFFSSDGKSVEIVTAIVCAFIAPILYFGTFIALNVVLSLLYFLLTITVLRTTTSRYDEDGKRKSEREYNADKKKENNKFRLFSFILSFATGIAFLCSIFAPIGYYLNFADENSELITQLIITTGEEEEKDNEAYYSNGSLIAKADDGGVSTVQNFKFSNILLDFYQQLTAPFIQQMTTFKVGENEVTAKDFMTDTADVVKIVLDMLEETEGESGTLPVTSDKLLEIAEKMKDSPALDEATTIIVGEAANSWKDGEDFCGIPAPDFGDEATAKLVYNVIAAATENDAKASDIVEATSGGVEIANDVLKVMDAGNQLKDLSADMIYEISQKMNENEVLNNVVTTVITEASNAWKSGEEFLGMKKPDLGLGEEAMNSILDVLTDKDISAADGIQAIGNIITVSNVISGAVADGEKAPSMTELVNTLTKDSASILKSIITVELIQKVTNCDEETAKAFMSVVDTALDTLLSDKYTQEQKNKEASALDKIIALATDPDGFDSEAFVTIAKDSEVLKSVLNTITEGGAKKDPFSIAERLGEGVRQKVIDTMKANGIAVGSDLYDQVMAIITAKEA